MRAAILGSDDAELRIHEIPMPCPSRGEVRLRVAACGVCHTDLHVIKGEVAFPRPCVLGHEISGIVDAVGEDVTGTRVGDRVVCSFIMPCGDCRHCVRGHEDLCERFFAYNRLRGQLYDGASRLSDDEGSPIAMYSMGGLAEFAIVPASDVFALPDDVDLADSAIIGCSLFTAYGAVNNVAQLRPGETVAIVAAGGVGLNIVQVARAFGASKIIVVDVVDDKLSTARRLGATHTVNSSRENADEAVRAMTDGRGVDVAFEALGRPETVEAAISMVDDGGRVVMVGIGGAHGTADLAITHVVRRKIQILGSYGARARTDMPRLISMVADGRLSTGDLITRRYPLHEVGSAYSDLAAGSIVGRAIIEMERR